MKRRLLAPLLLLPLTLSAQSTPPSPDSAAQASWKKLLPQDAPQGLRIRRLLVAAHPEHSVELIVYIPDQPGIYPAILDIHGGGWNQRQIELDRPMMERLAQRGFVTALVSYRLASEAHYPAALHDCKAAIRFLRAHAAALQINPERIGLIGGSAGGHLAALTALTSGKPEFEGPGPHSEADSSVQACISMAATQDLIASNLEATNPKALAFFGFSCAENPDLYRAASPITHIRPGVPPLLFIEGEKDTPRIGRPLAMEKLKAAGVETGLHTLPEAPHPFWMSDPWCSQTVEIATQFFAKHLGGVQPLIPD